MCINAREAAAWWTPDPTALSIVVLSTSLYARGLYRLWRSGTRATLNEAGHGIRRWEAACFVAGQLSLLVALVSPLDRLSDILFSAHMTQHEIIMLVSPVLILLGRPWVAAVWALPRPLRARITAAMRHRPVHAAWRYLSHPFVVLLVHAAVVWLWHVPALFDAAMRNELVHGVQHATFFGTAALFWWAILRGRYGRRGYGLAVAFVFATAMHTSILGALLTVARELWYPIYGMRGAPWDVDAMEDQTLAGLIMWIPAGALLTVAALALFAAWLSEAGRRVAAAERRRAS